MYLQFLVTHEIFILLKHATQFLNQPTRNPPSGKCSGIGSSIGTTGIAGSTERKIVNPFQRQILTYLLKFTPSFCGLLQSQLEVMSQ